MKKALLGTLLTWIYAIGVHFLTATLFYFAFSLGLFSAGIPPLPFWSCFGLWSAWIIAIIVPFMICYNVAANKTKTPEEIELDE